MKTISFLVLFFLAHNSFSQEDTLQARNVIEKLFNTADKMVDIFSGKSWIFIPAVTYSPETSLGFGLKALKVFRIQEGPGLRPSTLPITLLYSLNRQIMFNTAIDLWLNGNKDHFYARIDLMDYPFEFFGTGNQLKPKKGEPYASRIIGLEVNFQKQIAPGFFLGPQYVFRFDDLYQKKPGGMLASGLVPGSNGQRTSGLGILFQFDTRDNIFQPGKGSFNQLSYLGFHRYLGSNYGFSKYELDLRKYVRVYRSHVIAGQVWYSISPGHVPFQQLPITGGSDLMRGYFEGKYRDQMAMVYQMEYRLPVYRNLGLVFFGSAGQVGKKFSSFAMHRFRYGGGLGMRYKLQEDGLNFRLDIAFGDQPAVYFGLNEVL